MTVVSRQVRENLKSSFFHVMIQGIRKEYIFSKEQYIKMYLKLLSEKRKKLKIKIIAYCIMNNHAHLLIETKNIKELSKSCKSGNGKR
ncbi:MAG: transposase [Clostridia bacterium]